MSGTITGKTYSKTHFHNFFGTPYLWVIFIFSLFFSSWGVVGQNGVTINSPESDPTNANPIPFNVNFEFGVDELTIGDFGVNNGELNIIERLLPTFENSENFGLEVINVFASPADFLDKYSFLDIFDEEIRAEYLTQKVAGLIIAVDINEEGDIFYLTYGNGLFKHNPNGNNQNVIPGSEFETPLDFVINKENGKFYVADKDKRQILIFNKLYQQMGIIGTGDQGGSNNDFRGPTGISLDKNGNVYVADAFTGITENIDDEVKIFDGNGNFIGRFSGYESIAINDPYRIAVDKEGKIYLSDAGENESSTGRILIFNSDYSLEHIVPNNSSGTESPGSLIVDDFGYLYVINYEGDLSFNAFFTNPEALLGSMDDIRTSNYSIDVYSPFNRTSKITIISENLNLPLDLTLNECGTLFVIDSEFEGDISGNILGYPTNVDIDFIFNIKKYERQDNFTISVTPDAPGEITVSIENQTLFKCGPQPAGEFSIVYGPEEAENPTFDCSAPEDLTLDLDDDCLFDVPDYSGNITNRQNFTDIDIRQEEVVTGDLMIVTLEVYDGAEYIRNCIFEVALLDVTAPEITFCDSSPIEMDLFAGESFTIQNYTSRISVTDSCDDVPVILQDPPEGATISESTTVRFIVRDESGNEATSCSFEIIINETPPEPVDPTFDCSAPEDLKLDLDEDCLYDVPDYSGYITNRQNFTDIDVRQEEVVTGDLMIVTLEVYDGAEYISNCIFEVALLDVTAPEITFCDSSPIEMDLSAGETFTIPNYTSRISVMDFCDDAPVIVQDPPEGATILESTTVRFTVSDGSGNEAISCSFEIIINDTPPAPVAPTFDCSAPEDLSLELDEDCTFAIADYSDYITNRQNFTDIDIRQEEVVTGDLMIVSLEVYNGAEYIRNCIFEVALLDVTAPEITFCDSSPIEMDLSAGETFTIQNYTSRISVTDSCDDAPVILQDPPEGATISESTTVRFIVRDESGNEATSCSFEIIIKETPPEPVDPDPNPEPNPVDPANPYDYIYIYPNPTTGPITFWTPSKIKIEKVEVYDHRGRFILMQDFSESVERYEMDLSGLQQAVYILHLFTTDGNKVIRVIIR